MIWRHLRRRFGEELSRLRADGTTNLDAIVQDFTAAFDGNLNKAFEARPIRDCTQGWYRCSKLMLRTSIVGYAGLGSKATAFQTLN